MEFIIQIGIVLEIILVNLTTITMNSKKKKSIPKIIAILSIYTVFLIVVGYTVLKQFSFYGNGNGIFTMMGFLYLPIFRVVFEESNRRNFFTICYAWIYTLTVFSISVQLGYMFADYGRYFITLLSESIFFIITISFSLRFMKQWYLPLLTSDDDSLHYYLEREIFIWFLTIFVINLNFIFSDSYLLRILAFMIIIANVVFSFIVIYEVLDRGKLIGSLEKQVTRDSLTKLGNRIALMKMMTIYVRNEKDFSVIFMDLDCFKSINDTYGHSIGDEYLISFAKQLAEIGKERTYRIAGDEFIVLCDKQDEDYVCECIHAINFTLLAEEVKFCGVSIGKASYPQDACDVDRLIQIADEHMYRHKHNRVH